MTMISGQRCLVLGRVTEPGEFLELSGDALRTLVARDAELSEILMRAFHPAPPRAGKRRLRQPGAAGLAPLRRTLNLREFLSRNGHPYTYVDLDDRPATRRPCSIAST
jgi:thioredoxin reductase (NADPH)